MNFNNHHPSDDIIERELRALREPVPSAPRLGDAILAMKAQPQVRKARINPWVLRLGTVGMAAVGIAAGISLTTPKAYAQELKEIASAFKQHQARYMKAYIYSGNKTPMLVTELWTENNFQKFWQLRNDKLEAADVSDGKLCYRYISKDLAVNSQPVASIDIDTGAPFGVETIDAMLNSEFFRKRKIVKTSGVVLNGKVCDYYDFANGYYRMWVDPATKLPVQREVYDKGKTLWERDVYDYPTGFPAETFKAPQVAGVTYFDYPEARAKLESALAASGTTRMVGDIKVTLKAILRDQQSVTALFQSAGDQGKFNDERRMPLPGIRFFTENFKDDEITVAKPEGLKNERMYLVSGTSLKNLETIKIGVWKKDQFVGYAEFPYKNVIEVPFSSNVLRKPAAGPVQAVQAGTAKTTNSQSGS